MPAEMAWSAPWASITAVTTASTIAPPTWNEVWNMPEARPCSWSATPPVARTFSAAKARVKAAPMSSSDGRMTAG